MTGIARLQIGKRHRLCVGGSLWNSQAAGREHLLDRRNDPFEQPGSPKRITASASYRADGISDRWSRTPLGLARNLEGYRNNCLEFEDIRDVAHEREWPSGMQKADRRRVA